MKIRYLYFLLIALCGIILASCKTWDDRLVSENDDLGKSLYAEISTQTNLSKFKELLEKSGYDKVISSSKNYTVWAPTNDALANLSTTIINDTTALKAFVGNHIALQSHVMPSTQTSELVGLLNGKYASFGKDVFATAAITSSNKYVGNGVLHVIGSAVQVLPSLWAYVNATQATSLQSNAIVKLTTLVFNPNTAIVDSISATTGQPVYRPGTGFQSVNSFTEKVYDLGDESKRYTYFLLPNDVFTQEVNKLSPYYKTSTTDSTYRKAAFETIKDLVIEGEYSLEQLPTTIKSKFDVNYTIDKSAITQSFKVSNGIVHVLGKINVSVTEKFKPIIIQGENYIARMPTTSSLASTAIATRTLLNPLTNTSFKSVFVVGHANAGFWLRYVAPETPSIKYKVYWVAVNDLYNSNTATGETATFVINQKLAMGSLSSATFAYPAAAMPVKNYTEQLLGEYTVDAYGTLNMYLVANGTNAMALDYIKLVPAL